MVCFNYNSYNKRNSIRRTNSGETTDDIYKIENMLTTRYSDNPLLYSIRNIHKGVSQNEKKLSDYQINKIVHKNNIFGIDLLNLSKAEETWKKNFPDNILNLKHTKILSYLYDILFLGIKTTMEELLYEFDEIVEISKENKDMLGLEDSDLIDFQFERQPHIIKMPDTYTSYLSYFQIFKTDNLSKIFIDMYLEEREDIFASFINLLLKLYDLIIPSDKVIIEKADLFENLTFIHFITGPYYESVEESLLFDLEFPRLGKRKRKI